MAIVIVAVTAVNVGGVIVMVVAIMPSAVLGPGSTRVCSPQPGGDADHGLASVDAFSRVGVSSAIAPDLGG